MKPKFFKTQKDLRTWFEKNYKNSKEQWIGFYKKGTGKPSITWPESVDEALCFGWIDGLRKSIDNESYMIRFTPRKPGSNWSRVNINKVEKLKKLGLMKPEGLKAYENKKDNKSEIYAYEQDKVSLDKKYEDVFKKNKKAWHYFSKELAPSYKKVTTRWVMSAKREETRLSRLKILIESSAKGELIPQMSKYKK